jgi:O-antigen/teichoic acid export membrane protein/GT2 family glycosyltransferase
VTARGAPSAAGRNDGLDHAGGPRDRARADLLGTAHGRRRLASTVAASFALPVSAIVTGPIFARTIEASGRGIVTAVTAPMVLGASIAGAGLHAATVYFVAGGRVPLAAVVRRSWALALVTGTIVGAIVAVAAPFFLRKSPDYVDEAVLVALAVPVVVLGRAARAAAVAQREFGLVNATTGAAAVLRTLVVVLLAWQGVLGVGAAIAVLVGYEVLSGLPVLLRALPWRRPRPAPQPGLTRRMAGYGGAAAVGSMASVVTLRLDLVVLAPLVSSEDLGLYVFAFGLTELWSGVIRAGVTVALPEAVRTGDLHSVAHLTRVLVLASVVVVVSAILVGPTVVEVLYGPGYDRTAELLPVLLAGASLFALEGLPATALLADGRPGRRSVGQVVGGLLTVVGLLVAAPRYGIGGAAVVSVVAYVTAAVVTLAQVSRRSSLPWREYVVWRSGDLRRVIPVRGPDRVADARAPTADRDSAANRVSTVERVSMVDRVSTVDVVVPTWRRPGDLERCLGGLAAQTRSADRVLVVARPDDAASHRVLGSWRSRMPALDVVAVDRPGQVAALNAGLAASVGDLIVIFDDDAVPDPDWLDRAAARFAAEPDLGGVCGRDRLFQEGSPVMGRTRRRVGSVTWFGRITGLFHLGPEGSHDVAHLKGCAMAYRADAVAGLRFDEGLRGGGAQPLNDTAFSMGVAERGWRLAYDALLGVEHRQGARHGSDARHHDRAGRDRPEVTADWAYNELRVVLATRGSLGRAVVRAWYGLVGSRVNPGAVQCLRRLPAERGGAVRRWRVAARARRDAVRDRRAAPGVPR